MSRFAVFRCDGGPGIGNGHVVRCLTLADALAAEGWRCAIACNADAARSIPALARCGHEVHEISAEDGPAGLRACRPQGCDLPLLKAEGNRLWLVGARGREMGGSAYWRQLGIEGGRPPQVDFESARKELTAVHEAIEKGLVAACHDISEGGLLVAAFEMAQPSSFGLRIMITLPQGVRADEFLLSEHGGFLIEADPGHDEALAGLFRSRGVVLEGVGQVRDSRHLTVLAGDRTVVDLNIDRVGSRWKQALKEAMQ